VGAMTLGHYVEKCLLEQEIKTWNMHLCLQMPVLYSGYRKLHKYSTNS